MARALQGKPYATTGRLVPASCAGARPSRLLVLLFLLLAAVPAALHASEGQLSRWPLVEALPAPSELARGERADRFVPWAKSALRPDGRLPTLWRVRSTRDFDAAVRPLLALYAPYNNRVTVFAPPSYVGITRTIRDAGLDPRWSRHALVFPLPATLRSGDAVYVMLDPGRRFPVKAALESEAQFGAGEVRYLHAMVAMLAMLAVMWIVVGAFGFVLRERAFLLLFGALGFELLYLLFLTGEAYVLPGLRHAAVFGVHALWISRALGSACLLGFARDFLDLDRHAPRLGRMLGWSAIGFVLLVVGSLLPWPPPRTWVPFAGNALLFGSSLLALAAGLVAARHGSHAAGFFFAAWTPMLALDMLREGQLLGLDVPYFGDEYALPAATAFAALMFSIGVAHRVLGVRQERDQARRDAERDALTGVLNRSALATRLERACEKAWRESSALSVLFLDLDHFKRVNDTFGHAIGDACLKALVRCIARELRQNDSVGRHGGEEFVVLLPGADLPHAASVAERIRTLVELRCREVDTMPVRLTLSAGVAEFSREMATPAQLVAHADEALYQAKREGRNRVCVYRPTRMELSAEVA